MCWHGQCSNHHRPAIVHVREWFSKPLSVCTDTACVLCPNPRLAGRVIRVMGREILLLTAYSEQSDARRVLSHERRRTPIHVGSGFISTSPLVCGKICIFMEAVLGSKSWERRWSQLVPHARAGLVGVRSLTSLIIFCCQRSYRSSLRCTDHAQHGLRIGRVQRAYRHTQQTEKPQHASTSRQTSFGSN